MGKLLRRFLHGLLPSSWVVKIKLSDSSPRKLLPSFRGGTAESLMTVENCGSTNSASASVGRGSKTEISTEARDKLKSKEQKQEAKAMLNTGIIEKNCAVVVRSGRRKRKSECLEEWNASSSNNHSRRWNSKRAKKASKAIAISAELPDCLCEVVGDTNAVVKYVEDPDQELWESMVEMIVGNGLWELQNLECLLYCYLSLNDSPLHHTIETTFLRVLNDLHRTS